VGDVCLRAVTVRVLSAGASRGADREALHAFVAEVTDTDPALVRVDQRCAHCGATDHGRPEASVAGCSLSVSLARTPGVTVLAVGAGPLGVDVERPSRVAVAPLDVFTAGERQRAAAAVRATPSPNGAEDAAETVHLTACWAVKEAVLKRDGRGLRMDPGEVEAVLRPLGTHPSVGDHARFAGDEQPVTVLRLDEDLVLAVAAGGAVVQVQDHRPEGLGGPRRRR
jgi:4'-phosphopantetheinyl transferase